MYMHMYEGKVCKNIYQNISNITITFIFTFFTSLYFAQILLIIYFYIRKGNKSISA